MPRSICLGLCFASLFAASVASAGAAPAYKVTHAVALGAPDRWDYVVYDAPSHRVYVAHGDRVTVVDGQDGRLIGEVLGMPGGTHGIGVSVATGEGFTDDGEKGEVVAFDLKTLKVTHRIKADPDADGIAFEPKTGHVFVIEGDSANIAVIDPKTDSLITRIKGGGKLEYAVADASGNLFVNGAENKEVLKIDAASNTIAARFAIPECLSPHGLAIDVKAARLFVSCVNTKLFVLDASSGRIVASLPIGKGTDAAAFDASHGLVLSSNGRDGNVTVIRQEDAEHYSVAGAVPTGLSGRTMDVDPVTGRIFVVLADLDPPPAATPNARPKAHPGSTRLLFLDPQ